MRKGSIADGWITGSTDVDPAGGKERPPAL